MLEDIDSQKKPTNKKTKNETQIDRVILGKTEAELLAKWVEDFNRKADGLIKVSRADVVNFLIANHATVLSNEETQTLAIRNFDEARWLAWSMLKMKEAKKKGSRLSFDELTAFRNTLLSLHNGSVKKKKSNKFGGEAASADSTIHNELALETNPNSPETTPEQIGEK